MQQLFTHAGRLCKKQMIPDNGREVVLCYVRSREMSELTTSCLLGGDSYPAEGVTEGDSAAFVIPAETFHACLDQSVFFVDLYLKIFPAFYQKLYCAWKRLLLGPLNLA